MQGSSRSCIKNALPCPLFSFLLHQQSNPKSLCSKVEDPPRESGQGPPLRSGLGPTTAPCFVFPALTLACCFALSNSLIKISHFTSSHNRFLLSSGSLSANIIPLARSTASRGTSKSRRLFWFAIGAFGNTNAPSATLPMG